MAPIFNSSFHYWCVRNGAEPGQQKENDKGYRQEDYWMKKEGAQIRKEAAAAVTWEYAEESRNHSASCPQNTENAC